MAQQTQAVAKITNAQKPAGWDWNLSCVNSSRSLPNSRRHPGHSGQSPCQPTRGSGPVATSSFALCATSSTTHSNTRHVDKSCCNGLRPLLSPSRMTVPVLALCPRPLPEIIHRRRWWQRKATVLAGSYSNVFAVSKIGRLCAANRICAALEWTSFSTCHNG